MTKRMARTGLFAGVLAVVIVCAVMVASQTAYADGANGTIKWGKKMTVSKAVYCADIDMGSKFKGAKKVTLKSSNKKVLKPMGYYSEVKALLADIGKKGTTTLTVKIKTKKGTKTYKGKLKVVAYKNPVSKFKLGSKDLAKKFKSDTYYDYNESKKKTKVSIKAKKGWKVKKITYGYWSTSKDKWVEKKLKNNSSFTLKEDGGQLVVYLYKKSNNQTETLIVTPVLEN